jgi:hypothetical protein
MISNIIYPHFLLTALLAATALWLLLPASLFFFFIIFYFIERPFISIPNLRNRQLPSYLPFRTTTHRNAVHESPNGDGHHHRQVPR